MQEVRTELYVASCTGVPFVQIQSYAVRGGFVCPEDSIVYVRIHDHTASLDPCVRNIDRMVYTVCPEFLTGGRFMCPERGPLIYESFRSIAEMRPLKEPEWACLGR